MPGRRNFCREYCHVVGYILVAIMLSAVTFIGVAYRLFELAVLGVLSLAFECGIYRSGWKCHGLRRRWDNALGFIWEFMTGPADVVVPQMQPLLQRSRRLWEIASAVLRFFRRRDTQTGGTRDNIATGHPENVGSAPEYDAASASSISNQDDESSSLTIRRFVDPEPTRSLNPPYPMITWPRPAWNEQHRNPSRLNLRSSIPFTLAPDSDMEEITEERNRNWTSNESEYSCLDGIGASPTPLRGPSELECRRGEESNETEVHPHSLPISCELHDETQLRNPGIQSETLPATHQQVIRENLPDQVTQTEESAAVSLTMHQRTSLEDSCQAEHDETVE